MVVFVVECVTPGLRGELTRWMLEIKAGMFVGTLSGMVRDRLWEQVCTKAKSGAACMVYSADTEQGFAIRSHGTGSRLVEDFDGLSLIRIPI